MTPYTIYAALIQLSDDAALGNAIKRFSHRRLILRIPSIEVSLADHSFMHTYNHEYRMARFRKPMEMTPTTVRSRVRSDPKAMVGQNAKNQIVLLAQINRAVMFVAQNVPCALSGCLFSDCSITETPGRAGPRTSWTSRSRASAVIRERAAGKHARTFTSQCTTHFCVNRKPLPCRLQIVPCLIVSARALRVSWWFSSGCMFPYLPSCRPV